MSTKRSQKPTKAEKKTSSKLPWYRQPMLLGIAVGGVVVVGLIVLTVLLSRPGESFQVTRPVGQDFLPEMGDPNAPVTVYEYSDYQCPFCAQFALRDKPKLEEMHIKTGNVRFIYRNFIVKGEKSVLAAEAAFCAAEQGGFWAYHDMLFAKHERGVDFNKSNLIGFARELGLDEKGFTECLDSKRYRSKVEEEHREGERYGVTGTPSFVVNGRLVRGADYFSLLETIKQELGR
ncbi:MAG: DsbA family protein [Candidatus Bipolaricaulota bacterium]|nr:DsbA family protein [Candidatus Bipolaricaulota bacterium]